MKCTSIIFNGNLDGVGNRSTMGAIRCNETARDNRADTGRRGISPGETMEMRLNRYPAVPMEHREPPANGSYSNGSVAYRRQFGISSVARKLRAGQRRGLNAPIVPSFKRCN